MAVDYDLVIVGGSRVGIYAAQKAALLQARVALVTQLKLLPDRTVIGKAIAEIGQWNYSLNSYAPTTSTEIVSLAAAQKRAIKIEQAVKTSNSLANLAALGVDVIVDTGEFCRLPQLAFQTAKRKLRSRKFLVATGASFVPDFMSQSDSKNYLTLDKLWQSDLAALGQKIVVVGGNPAALELAQTLVRFQKDVTLVTPQQRILPDEDSEVVLLLQAQLESEGIKIYTNAPVSQIKTIDGQKWLQAGNRALTCSEIIFADRRQLNISGLNLKGVDVKCDRVKIHVNRQLKTSNPDIYACGDVIGGYSLPSIARHEADIILKNTLFLPFYRANYNFVPWTISTQPNFARVGLTTKQAQAQYEDLYLIKEYIPDLDRAQIANCTTGMCKLLVRKNGEIVGCSLISDRAEELIVTISLMMQHKIKLDSNPMQGLSSGLAAVYPSMSEIWQRASDNFYRQKLQQNPALLIRLRSWHSWRKQWHK